MAHSRNMTGREKFMAQSQSLGDDIAIAIYGETMESMYQQAKAAQRKTIIDLHTSHIDSYCLTWHLDMS